MELIPDWAPNIHPMIVHFPIALIVGALGADIFSLVLRRWEWLRPATVAL
ncbi:putative membrane protein, partial [Salinibacter ruber]|nr:putative membrane protein [Salinibacter ruber]MCS4170174.1 putative membrane protein [Salinibacter ruber]